MRMPRARTLLVGIALIAALLAPHQVLAQGCAMCGTAFNHDDPVARAFNWSVLFLIAMPYTVFALAAGGLFLAPRPPSSRRRAAGTSPAPARPLAGPEGS